MKKNIKIAIGVLIVLVIVIIGWFVIMNINKEKAEQLPVNNLNSVNTNSDVPGDGTIKNRNLVSGETE